MQRTEPWAVAISVAEHMNAKINAASTSMPAMGEVEPDIVSCILYVVAEQKAERSASEGYSAFRHELLLAPVRKKLFRESVRKEWFTFS